MLEHELFEPENRSQVLLQLFYRGRAIRPSDLAITSLTASGSDDSNQGLAAQLNYAENSNQVILSIVVCYFRDEPQISSSSVELRVTKSRPGDIHIDPVFHRNIMDVTLEPVTTIEPDTTTTEPETTTLANGSELPVKSPQALGGDTTTAIFIVIAGAEFLMLVVLVGVVICLCRRPKSKNKQYDLENAVERSEESSSDHSEADLQTAVPRCSTPIPTHSSSPPDLDALTPESNHATRTGSYQDMSLAERSTAALTTAGAKQGSE